MRKVSRVFAILFLMGLYIFDIRLLSNAETSPQHSDKQIVSGSFTNVPSESQALTKELNRVRRATGSPELVEDSRLIELASKRAKDMADNHYYSHKSPGGLFFYHQLELVGLRATLPSCENLLLENTHSVSEIVSAWMGSADHKKCLLNSDYTRVGTASVVFGNNLLQDNQDTVLTVAIFSVDQ